MIRWTVEPMEKYEPIIQFFQSIGAKHEASMYLKLFKKGDPARFAVIQIDHRVSESLELVGIDLAYLSNLDLYPIILHDTGEDDSRPVTKKSPKLKHVLSRNKELTDMIHARGGRARGLTRGVFEVLEGSNGRLFQVNTRLLRSIIRQDAIPVVAPLVQLASGQMLLLDAQEAAKALILGIQPKKYILLLKEEGIWNKEGHIISLMNIGPDMNHRPALAELTPKGAAITRRLASLILMNEDPLLVAITSPENLLRELFTIKGGGTLVKRGSKISRHLSYDEVNKPKLKQLLESCFGKRLKASFFQEPISFLLLEESYKGAAIVTKVGELFYLDKFAVRKESQGEGTGADIWEELLSACPRLFWRSKLHNPINEWYYACCSGMQKSDDWYVWWINVPASQRPQVLDHALTHPESFQEAAGSIS